MQGALESALGRVLREPVSLVVAGRTDAGVHAWGQVVSFELPRGAGIGLDDLLRRLNRMCGPGLGVRSLEEVPAEFSARFSATARRYRYRIITTPWRHPFLERYAWWVGGDLDLEATAEAGAAFLGEHDFAAFCKVGAAGGTVRRVLEVSVAGRPESGVVDVWVEAKSFGHQMVRSLVGLLVTIGRGRRPVSDAAGVLAGTDRAANSNVAPPHGLTLWQVRYPDGVDAEVMPTP